MFLSWLPEYDPAHGLSKIKMNQYNPNIHHRRSIRLKGYDYSQAGLYFVTICCQDRICRFGEINNGEMILNKYGQIAYNEWMKTPQLRPNVELDAFIVMPNHIHGVLKINEIGRGELHSPNNDSFDNKGECNSPLRSPSNTVGAIVRGYKSSVTKQLRLMGFNEKLWQRNYYEHIICNNKSYLIISKYILNNPVKWKEDKFCIR